MKNKIIFERLKPVKQKKKNLEKHILCHFKFEWIHWVLLEGYKSIFV